jgi:large subunit ribosomal protein L13
MINPLIKHRLGFKDMQKNVKSFMLNKKDLKPTWFVLNAAGKTLGRLTSEITKILRGKHKPTFTPHLDCGDYVIVVNAGQVRVTGAKEAQKVYRYHTGAMSGMREIPYREMKQRKPTYMIEHAVKGMMPKTRLGKQQLRKLRIFAGEEHPLVAQQPIQVNI